MAAAVVVVQKQRANYRLFQKGKQSSMTTERIKMLESVGFVWNAILDDWGALYAELKRYRQKHGHCLVPQQYSASPYVAILVVVLFSQKGTRFLHE